MVSFKSAVVLALGAAALLGTTASAKDLPPSVLRGSTFKSLTRASPVAGTSSGPMCFDIAANLCWQWTATATDITFSMTCKPVLVVDPGWCAIGINLAGNSMAPAEVYFLSKLKNGTVLLEQRFNPSGHDAPVCVPTSYVTVQSAAANGGTLTATFTRPLLVPVNTTGVANITVGASQDVIAAWADNLSTPQSTPCATGWHEHLTTYRNKATF